MLRIILCNVPPDAADALAETLVSERLAACVNLIPGVRSVYVWQGELVRDEEVTLLIKTTDAVIEATRARIEALHPYTTPELVTLAPEHVSDAYGRWAAEVVAPQTDAADQ